MAVITGSVEAWFSILIFKIKLWNEKLSAWKNDRKICAEISYDRYYCITLFCILTCTPCETKCWITSTCPCLAAQYMALSPRLSTRPRLPPFVAKTFRMSNCPSPAATWIAPYPCLLVWLTSIFAIDNSLSKPSLLFSSMAQKMADRTKLSPCKK